MYGQQRVWWGCAHAQAHMSIHWKNIPYIRPFCAGAKSSDCSGETERKLSLVWALTDKIWHIHTRFFVHVRELWRFWQECMHAKAFLRIHWIWPYGHMYAHFVHVWEQWMRWRDCKHAKARLRIHRKKTPYVCPFCAYARAVKALVELHTCACAS